MELKPPSPLRARNRRFGAVFGRRGAAGFSGALLGSSSGVVGFIVAMFVRAVREIFRPARPGVGTSAKKFAQRRKNGPKWAFYGLQGEFFSGRAAGSPVLGEFFRETRRCDQVLSAARHPPYRWRWGFCTIRAWLAACRRRVAVLMTPFPPFGGGEAAGWGSEVPKLQTTSSK